MARNIKIQTQTADKFQINTLINCVRNGDKIESRKGFSTRPEDYVFKTDGSEGLDMSFHITDCYLFSDGKYGRVALNIADNLMGSITYNIMLICADKTNIPLGKINFTASGGAMGFPDTFAVFSGKSNQGSGIYFISRKLYDEDYPDMISVRELSSDRTRWNLLSESLIYTPLVLVNGRGEAYHNAEASGRALSLPSPLTFESKNILNSRFKAAYTTDGASASFSLPYSKIDNNSLDAELLYKGEKYSLKITGADTKSPSVLIDSAEVVMNVDRNEGRVYFTKDGGGYWIPEFTGSLNNLCFTAYKTVEEHIKMVGAVSAGQKIEGDITALYKSATEPSSVIINSPTDPLYFPENTASKLGNAKTEVAKMLLANGNIFAFKEGEIYTCAIKAYTPNKKTASVLGVSTETDEYKLTFKKKATFAGVAIAETVSELSGDILFQTKDNTVWKLKASNSSAVSPEKIEELSTAFDFAVADKDRYILIKDNRAVIFEKTEKGYEKGEWILPENAVCGFSYVGEALFFFRYCKDETYIIYASRYGGENDVKFLSEHQTEESEIKSVIDTQLLSDVHGAKRIYQITVSGKGKMLEVSLLNRNKTVLKRRVRLDYQNTEIYMGANVKEAGLSIAFCKPTSINRICTLFSQSKEVK